jgi:hypothetical protein
MSRSFFFAFSSLLHVSYAVGQKCSKCGDGALCSSVPFDFLAVLNVTVCAENRRLRGQVTITQFVTTLNGGNLANVGNTPSCASSAPKGGTLVLSSQRAWRWLGPRVGALECGSEHGCAPDCCQPGAGGALLVSSGARSWTGRLTALRGRLEDRAQKVRATPGLSVSDKVKSLFSWEIRQQTRRFSGVGGLQEQLGQCVHQVDVVAVSCGSGVVQRH